MGFHQKNFVRIRAEYEKKYKRAEDAADERRREVWAKDPKISEIDRRMSETGLRVMRAAINGQPITDIRAGNESLLRERTVRLLALGLPADYTDPVYECPLCKDSGYIGYKMCSCMRQRLIEAGYESSGIASLMRTQRFDNFNPEYYRSVPGAYDIMKFNLAVMQDYAAHFSVGVSEDKPSPSLTLTGGTGLGKTHLSTAVAKAVIDKGFDVVYVSAADLFDDFDADHFRAREGGADVDRYFDCDLLILDDLGTELVTQFTVSSLYRLINVRVNRVLPTIISTNYDSKKIREVYGDRIASRLFGEFRPLIFAGKDVRMLKIAEGR